MGTCCSYTCVAFVMMKCAQCLAGSILRVPQTFSVLDNEKYRLPRAGAPVLGFYLHTRLQAPCCQTDLQSSPAWGSPIMCKAVQDGEEPWFWTIKIFRLQLGEGKKSLSEFQQYFP